MHTDVNEKKKVIRKMTGKKKKKKLKLKPQTMPFMDAGEPCRANQANHSFTGKDSK